MFPLRRTSSDNASGMAGLRLVIYLVLSFGLTWIWFVIALPGDKTWEEMPQNVQSFVSLGMLFPVISHVLTRWITKEGFAMTGRDSMMLGISFQNRRWIYFLLALILPWFYTELENIILLIAAPECYDPQYYLTLGIEKKFLFLYPAAAIVSGVVVSFAAFGEEGGWRAYMMPKLFGLMPKAPALIVGGIIWGLWHAPLTVIGHNFGTDYPGYPWFGVIRMCIFCILCGVLLTFVTEMSGSVWPAAILHAVNNAGPSILNGFINPDKSERFFGMDSGYIGGYAGLLIAVTLVLIWWRKGSGKTGRDMDTC